MSTLRTAVVLTLLCSPLHMAAASDAAPRPSPEERGKAHYEKLCISCHGDTARGDGPAAAALVKPVPDLWTKVATDRKTMDLVRFGRGLMPGFHSTLDRDGIRTVVQHMELISKPQPEKADGATENDPTKTE